MSNGRPVVSCVITSYNYGKYVAEAIDSVLDQSQKVDEIIVVDDGSTDNTSDVVAGFGDSVTLVRQRNMGVVEARNRGADQTSGEYLFFLDADDVLEPQFIEKLLRAVQESEASIGYCDFAYFGHFEGVVRANDWNVRKLLYRNYIIGAAIMERRAFDAVGGYSRELNQKASFEDWDLWLSMAEQGMSGAYVPEPLFRYRLHGTGRNGRALKHRADMESALRRRHPKLYRDPVNRAYLAVFGTASKIRNAIIKAPGTE